MARKYLNRQIGRIIHMFRYATQPGRRLVPPTVWHDLKTLDGIRQGDATAADTGDFPPAPVEDLRAAIDAAPPTLAAMIRLQWLTGMRPGELVKMRTIDIVEAGDFWEYRPPIHKNAWRRQKRVVMLAEEARQILESRLRDDVERPIFCPADVMPERRAMRVKLRKTPLNQGNRPGYSRRTREGGKPAKAPGLGYTTQSYNAAINTACRHAGVEPFGANRIRHTAGTQARAGSGSLDAAQVILGHKDARSTQRYAEPDPAVAAKALKFVG